MKPAFPFLFSLSFFLTLRAQNAPPALIPCPDKGMWGYCDTSGAMVIPATFDYAGYFTNMIYQANHPMDAWFAPVKKGRFYNWIDVQGNKLLPFDQIIDIRTDELNPSYRVVSLTLEGTPRMLFGVMDRHLQMVRAFAPVEIKVNVYKNQGQSERPVSDWNSINYGDCFLLVNHTDRLKGLIDETGKTIVEPIFEEISNIYKGEYLALLPGHKQWLLYALPDKVLDTFAYWPGSGINEGLVKVCNYTKTGAAQCGFVNLHNQIKVPFRYSVLHGFYNGVALGNVSEGAWEFLDKAGKTHPTISDPWDVKVYPNHLFMRKDSAHWDAMDYRFKPFPVKNFSAPPLQLTENGQPIYRFILGQDSVYTDMKGNIKGRHSYTAILPAKSQAFKSDWRKLGNLYWVQKGGKWGLASRKNLFAFQELLPPQLDEMPLFHYNLAFAKRNGLWGVIDTLGREIIPMEYGPEARIVPNIKSPDSSMIQLEKNGRLGFFDWKGKQLTPFLLHSQPLNHVLLDGTAIYLDTMDGITILYDRKRNYLALDSSYRISSLYFMDLGWDDAGKPAILVEKNGKKGLLDANFRWILPLKYLECEITLDGKNVMFADTGGWSLIERKSGKILHQSSLKTWLRVYENNIVKSELNPNPIPDSTGQVLCALLFSVWHPEKQQFILLPPNAYYMEGFQGGLIRYYEGGKIGFLDETLSIAIRALYDEAEPFNHSLAIVKKGGKQGLINRFGVEIIPCAYAFVRRMANGYFTIYKDSVGLCSLLDSRGKPVYENAQHFDLLPGGMFHVWPAEMKENLFELIDSTGKTIVSGISACYPGKSGVGFIKDGLYFEAKKDESNRYRVVFEIGETRILNDSLIWVGIATGGSCYPEYGIQGVLKKDGKTFIPIGQRFIERIDKTGEYKVTNNRKTALYDQFGRQKTDYLFEFGLQYDSRVPFCYYFEKQDRTQWWVTRNGRVICEKRR